MTRFVGHLPLVRLAGGATSLDLPHGRLRAVPFDEWYAIDSAFPYRQSQYERTSPVFFEIKVRPSHDGEPVDIEAFKEGRDEASAMLSTCHRALLLVTAARLPRPELSVSYLVIEGEGLPEDIRDQAVSIQYRRVGPAERELIVHGEQHGAVPVDVDDGREVAAVWPLLESGGELVSPVVDALVRTTRPGFTPLNEALHLIAGLEAMLVARGEPLTATFARRYSALASEDDVKELRDQARFLYGLRSDLVHGRPIGIEHGGRQDIFLCDDHRAWTCLVALRALQWFATRQGAGLADLRLSLDEAWTSPDELASLRSSWSGFDG